MVFQLRRVDDRSSQHHHQFIKREGAKPSPPAKEAKVYRREHMDDYASEVCDLRKSFGKARANHHIDGERF